MPNSVAPLTRILLLGIAIASAAIPNPAAAQWYKNVQHASGVVVSISPAPPAEMHSLVVKTDAGEVNFVLSEAAVFPTGVKVGDAVTIDYAVDAGGIHWASSVKKGSAGKTAGAGKP